jgi:hypothetical protein
MLMSRQSGRYADTFAYWEAQGVSMTFREYLAARRPRNDVQGDYVRLALLDKDMPAIQSLRQLTSYMRGSATLSDWIEPGSRVWADYAKAAIRAEKI